MKYRIYYDAFTPTKKPASIRVRGYDHTGKLGLPDWVFIILIVLCFFLSFSGFAFSAWCLSRIGA